MAKRRELSVLYVGDWVFHTGPEFVESPFYKEVKDCELHFYGKRLTEALEPSAELRCLSNWDLYRLRPGEFESHLKQSAVIIVSDVKCKCFHLYPEFFQRSKRTGRVMTYPDRLDSLKDWIAAGGGLMMLGGWLSFSGSKGVGGWGRSGMAEALPVQCLPGEDLVDSSAGFTPEVMLPSHPLAKGLPWKSFLPLFGYNEVIPKPDAEVVVRVKETGHPLLVAGRWGAGRILVYTSDPAPHWGINFELWEGYDAFWRRALKWTLGKGR